MLLVLLLVVLLLVLARGHDTIENSEVIDLTSKTFEHLTQAATGHTTGDWFVMFYAPWCGHCKELIPTWENVAIELKGDVNVAKVDVPANRDLGTRFDIKGFPTLKLFSKGQIYTFKGRRSFEELTDFARSGFHIHEPEQVAPEFGFFGETIFILKKTFQHAYDGAIVDIKAHNYFTWNILFILLPFIFAIGLIIIHFLPIPEPTYEDPLLSRRKQQEDARAARAAPPSSSRDNHTKNE